MSESKQKDSQRKSIRNTSIPKMTDWLSNGIHYVLLTTLWNVHWKCIEGSHEKQKLPIKYVRLRSAHRKKITKLTCIEHLWYTMLWTGHYNSFDFHCTPWHIYLTNMYQVLTMHQSLYLEQDRQEPCPHEPCNPVAETPIKLVLQGYCIT